MSVRTSQIHNMYIYMVYVIVYTMKCFDTQYWDLGGLGIRRSFTTRWRTASLSRALGRGGAAGTTSLIDAGSITAVDI